MKIGKYRFVHANEIEEYKARIDSLRIAWHTAEKRAEIAEAEKDAAVELLAEARDMCNAENAKAQELREQMLNQQKVIKTQKKEIERRLSETMQLSLDVEALRQENAALRKIVEADKDVAAHPQDGRAVRLSRLAPVDGAPLLAARTVAGNRDQLRHRRVLPQAQGALPVYDGRDQGHHGVHRRAVRGALRGGGRSVTIDEYNFCVEQRRLGRTYEWIAEKVGCSLGTVRTMIKNGYHLDYVNGKGSVHPGLEAWRKQHGYTVARLCVEAGVPYGTVSKLNGRVDPERMYLRDIRDILRFTGCTFEEIFGEEDTHHDVDAAQSRQHRRDDL